MPQVLGQPLAHQIDEVVAIETLDCAGRCVREAVVETLERIAATFDMWKIRREQASLVAEIGNAPSGVRMRIGCPARLPAHDLRRTGGEFLQPLLVLDEGLCGA